MGVEMIKDRQGKEHLVLSDEDFYNDDIMGDKFDDYEILQVLKEGKKKNGLIAKVKSKFNSKIYIMKKIDKEYNEQRDRNNFHSEFEVLKKLNHPNITRYYKYFSEGNNLYIIYEYVNNGDLYGFWDAYDSLDKPIEENTLWNIFMQSIEGLKYIHDRSISHGNISLNNIFMTENKIVKLGDFQFSFLDSSNNKIGNDKKGDIKALGKVFQKLCKLNNNREMNEIIKMMIQDEEEKRPTVSELYNRIMQEYIKNVAKLSSIDSVFRCIYAFQNFTSVMYEKIGTFSEFRCTPVSFLLLNCIQRYFTNEDKKENAIDLNNFRNLFYQNSQINNDIEIQPILVLKFLLEKLNRETGNNFNCPNLSIQPIYFDKMKEKSLTEFMNYFNSNFNSIISKDFVGFMKTKRICRECREGIYSFNLFPFIEFDLERCQNEKKLKNWFTMENNKNKILGLDHNVVCSKCGCVTEQNEFKIFHQLPTNFIICINRGEGYKNTSDIDYPLILDLSANQIEKKSSPNKFNLVGIVKRIEADKGGEYFVAIYKDHSQNQWIESRNMKRLKDPLEHREGLVMILFYSCIISIGN